MISYYKVLKCNLSRWVVNHEHYTILIPMEAEETWVLYVVTPDWSLRKNIIPLNLDGLIARDSELKPSAELGDKFLR